ncbi:MAG: hypothetical protein WCC60_20935, partial [Ilumatobacteraceae bacterium]
AANNASGLPFGDPVPNSFPKGDPYCYQAPPRGTNNSIVPPVLCGTDWMPYARNFADAARIGRIAFDGAKIIDNPNALGSGDVWTRDVPQYLGTRSMLTLTDTPSAMQFGLQMARLSRAGDDGAGRAFVRPDTESMTSGVAAMAAGSVPAVREPAPSASAPGAYPLTTITYAAVAPLSLDAPARSDYAAFVEYAAGPGQVPGLELGQLPRGYAPLPTDLQVQAMSAAGQIRTITAPVEETTTTAVVTTTTAPVVTAAPPLTQQTTRSTPRSNPPTATQATPAATVPAVTEPVVTEASTTTVPAAVDEADIPKATAPLVLTPFVALAKSRFAVPGLGAMALSSALGVLEITKRPRRKLIGDLDATEAGEEGEG